MYAGAIMSVIKGTNGVDGDKLLSPAEQELWALIYTCIIRFGCPVIFHVYGPNYTSRLDKYINFFIDSKHPLFNETKAYIESEIKHFEFKPHIEEEHDWYPNTIVRVFEFSGVLPYPDISTRKQIVDSLNETVTEILLKNNIAADECKAVIDKVK